MKNLILFIFIILFLSTKIDLFAQQNTDSTKKTKTFFVGRFGVGNSPSYFASTIWTLGLGVGLPNEKYVLGVEANFHNYLSLNYPSDYSKGGLFSGGLFSKGYVYDNLFLFGLSIQRSFTLSKSVNYKIGVGTVFCDLTTNSFIRNPPMSGGGFFGGSSMDSHTVISQNQAGAGINIRNSIALKMYENYEIEFSTLVHINTINTNFYGWQLFFNLRNY